MTSKQKPPVMIDTYDTARAYKCIDTYAEPPKKFAHTINTYPESLPSTEPTKPVGRTVFSRLVEDFVRGYTLRDLTSYTPLVRGVDYAQLEARILPPSAYDTLRPDPDDKPVSEYDLTRQGLLHAARVLVRRLPTPKYRCLAIVTYRGVALPIRDEWRTRACLSVEVPELDREIANLLREGLLQQQDQPEFHWRLGDRSCPRCFCHMIWCGDVVDANHAWFRAREGEH